MQPTSRLENRDNLTSILHSNPPDPRYHPPSHSATNSLPGPLNVPDLPPSISPDLPPGNIPHLNPTPAIATVILIAIIIQHRSGGSKSLRPVTSGIIDLPGHYPDNDIGTAPRRCRETRRGESDRTTGLWTGRRGRGSCSGVRRKWFCRRGRRCIGFDDRA